MPSAADEWIERGREIGKKEAIRDMRRKHVLLVVEERFDQVPPAVPDLVSNIEDEEKLLAMLGEASRAQTVPQLERMLREAREVA